MECIHELYWEDNCQTELYVYVDFEKNVLKIEFHPVADEKLEDGLVGDFQCASLDDLSETYKEKIAYILGEKSKMTFHGYEPESYDDEPIDLKKYYKLNYSKKKTPKLSKDETFAMDCIKKVLLKWNADTRLDNLVFYWNEEFCEGVYINNSGINGISEKELKKYLENSNAWLDGTFVEVIPARTDDIVETFDADFLEIQDEVDEYMYKICAILEAKKCFGLVKTADEFRSFNIWHDEEDEVDFSLRKKSEKKCLVLK